MKTTEQTAVYFHKTSVNSLPNLSYLF